MLKGRGTALTNKELIINFYKEVFENGQVSNISTYMREDYIQHNPTVNDGREGFEEFINKFLQQDPRIEILNITCENEYAYVFFKCTLKDGTVNKVCDIYRIKNSKLTEHWDVIEHHVEEVHSINGNTIF